MNTINFLTKKLSNHDISNDELIDDLITIQLEKMKDTVDSLIRNEMMKTIVELVKLKSWLYLFQNNINKI